MLEKINIVKAVIVNNQWQIFTFLTFDLFFISKQFVQVSFFKNIFWCGAFLKSLLNLLQYYFCVMFRFFGPKAYGVWAPRPGVEPAQSALEGEVLITGKEVPSLF